MHSAHNSNTFLAYFNQIDKYLSYALSLKKYVPYNERITLIVNGKYSVSSFVNRFESKLRYFGDLRNQLVHGFRLDSKHYLLLSDFAVEQIKLIHDELIKPKTVGEMFMKEIELYTYEHSLLELLEIMQEKETHYIPIEKDEKLHGVLSLQDVTSWLIDSGKKSGQIDLKKVSLSDVNIHANVEYDFVKKDVSVYQIQELFSEREKNLEVLFVTKNGSKNDSLHGMITLHDLPHIEDKFLGLSQ